MTRSYDPTRDACIHETGRQALTRRPADWNPAERQRCPRCYGNRLLEQLKNGRVVMFVCPLCDPDGRVMVGEPAESPYTLILDYT